jgi:hypothetical protein
MKENALNQTDLIKTSRSYDFITVNRKNEI